MGNSVIYSGNQRCVLYTPMYDAQVEYLESDGNSYIDTGLKASSELGILAHIQNSLDKNSFPFGGANALFNAEYGFQTSNGTYSSFRFGNEGSGSLPKLDANTIYEFDNTESHNIMNVNNIVYTATYNSFISDYNFHLFQENRADVTQGRNAGVRIYDFKIYQNSTLVRDFIPVRIGSTGYMFDKVSKQLFANKGTGQFILGSDTNDAVASQRSVGFERIYEEYEWLKTEGYAYINTGVKGNQDSRINVIAKQHTQSPAKTMTLYGSISNNTAYYDRAITFNASTANELKNTRFGDRVLNVQLDLNSVYDIYQDKDTLIINGEIKSSTSATNEFETTDYICLYAPRTNSSGDYTNRELSIKKFSIDGVIDLTPCQLLISIPAILDGNGIARQAGECGMWDKVSNRFYGNVASSGSFTVSND